ncbi:hypothetical protein V6N13_016829 [Hibiscus sabdariffa]
MGGDGGRCGGQLRDSDVIVGGDDGTGSVHVRHRTVQHGPDLVRQGPPQNGDAGERLRLSWYGIFTAVISLFTDLNVLLNMVSIGTLFVFYMVSNVVVYRRYVVIGTKNPWPTLSFLCLFSLTSIIFTLLWHLAPLGNPKPFVLATCVVIAVSILQVFHCMVPQARKPAFWGVPFMPWLPSISIFLNVFLLGSLDGPSYARFGFFSALAVLVYVLYSVHASFDVEIEGSLGQKNVEILEESAEMEDPSQKV